MDYQNIEQQEREKEIGLTGIEGRTRKSRLHVWKVILFLIIAIYFVLTLYRVPMLVKLGNYLIVEHEPQAAELIVCVTGKDVERSLAVVDIYNRGLAPSIFRAKKISPDGFASLKKRLKDYPSDYDLFQSILEGYGIPQRAIIASDKRVNNILEEAEEVHKLVLQRGFKSIIVVTSLINSRRTWGTFKKVFKNDDVTIISSPSHYQLFNPEDWWKNPRWVKEVIFEYQNLIYSKITSLT